MLYLQWKKTNRRALVVLIFIFITLSSHAQRELYQEEHDQKSYYFGISLGINKAKFQTHLSPYFLQQDSIMVAEAVNSGGFALGLLATVRLNERFELRFNPMLMFTERNLEYKLNTTHPPDLDFGYNVVKKVESVITTFPFHLKFRSDRIGNFRVYLLGGGKFDIDLASNAKARRADDMVRIQRFDYGIEAGMGFNFYFPSFILSPEIKFSNGLGNLHDRNEALKYSRVLEGIQSRMIMFTIHLEG
jgi:hypothetical protein